MTFRYFATAALAVLLASSALAQAPGGGAPHRPQEDAIAAALAPYRVETAAFDDPAAPGVRIAATLTLPDGAGPFGAVVLIAGSGRLDRDEQSAGHKPMLVLADALARRGYAVLRYDKGGVGQSTGDYAAATTLDFAADAAAAVAYLRSRADIAPAKVGLIGHSEGAAIAAIVAANDPRLAFVVMLSGPALPGSRLVAEQIRRFGLADGEAPTAAAQDYAVNRRFFAAIAAARDEDDAEARVREIAASADPKPTSAETAQAAHFARLPWMRFILAYDPRPTLRRVRIPVLALIGSEDLLAPPDLDLPALRQALAHDRDVTIMELPGLNHMLQEAQTGSPKAFAQIEQTLAPAALAAVTDWLARRAR